MSDDLQLSIYFLECILQNNENFTVRGLSDLYEIKNGNKKVILEHLKAVSNIINRAIKELEE